MQIVVCPWLGAVYTVLLCVKTLMTGPDAARAKLCVCITTALTGTASGEASSIVFILPLFVSPVLPLWPLVPNLTLLLELKLWQENELGLIGLGRRISPGMPWPLSGGAGCCQFCPLLPRAAVRCLGACSTLWEDVVSGKGD